MTRYLIGAAAAVVALASVATAAQVAPPPGVAAGTGPTAQPSSPGAPRMHIMFGGDKVMTRNEVADRVGKMFARLDTNHDGFITKDEVEAVRQKAMGAFQKGAMVEKRIAERGAMIGDRGAMFDRLDTNHDGNISRQEFMAGKPQIHKERVMIMHGGPAGSPGMHHGMKGMRMHGAAFGGHMFEMADANRDGRVSLQEAQSAALAHFDKADLNHDGRITPEERQQMHKTMRVERRQG